MARQQACGCAQNARLVPSVVNAADFNELSEVEARYFYKCSRCGEMVDKRELGDVRFHEDHFHKPDIQYRGSQSLREK